MGRWFQMRHVKWICKSQKYNFSLEKRKKLPWPVTSGAQSSKNLHVFISINKYYGFVQSHTCRKRVRDSWIRKTHSICGDTVWPGGHSGALLVQMSVENVGWLIGRAENRDWFIPQRNSCQIPCRCQALCCVLGNTKNKVEKTRSPQETQCCLFGLLNQESKLPNKNRSIN